MMHRVFLCWREGVCFRGLLSCLREECLYLSVMLALFFMISPHQALSAGRSSFVRLGMSIEPPNLDPTVGSSGAVDEIVYANIFEGLTRLDAEGTVRPALASHWDILEGGEVYIFYLRKGVKFHDGTDFDAHDVKFSLDRAKDPDSTNGQKELFSSVASVEVLDSLTVKVTLSEPDGGFLFNLAWGDAIIVDPLTASHNGLNPVGTGPFKFVRWARGDRVVLERFSAYWGNPARIEGAEFRFITDPSAAFSALVGGELDAYPYFPAPEFIQYFKKDKRFSIVIGTTEGEVIMAMNNKQTPLRDIRLRRAIVHAINRSDLIEGAVFGYGQPIGSHFPPHHEAYLDLTSLSAYDPGKSRVLLAEAGFEEGLELRLALPPLTYARRAGEIVAAQLDAVGIKITILNMEWAQWLDRVFQKKDFDLTIVAHTEAMDIGIYGRPGYYFGYENPDFNEILVQMKKAVNLSQRIALLQEAQREIAEDYVNAYLFQLAKLSVVDARLRGLWVNAPLQATDLTSVYWDE